MTTRPRTDMGVLVRDKVSSDQRALIRMTRHNVALDYLRTCIIVLVLGHHSALAYTYYARFDPKHYLLSTAPIVDTQRWRGFDLFVLFNDIFFMSLMFLLSGLFVWSSLARRGGRPFLRDRSLRLGLPFALAVTFLMPLAYYPSFRMTGADSSFIAFWWQCLSLDNWPAGPAWFIWLLLVFDFFAAALWWYVPDLSDTLGRVFPQAVWRPESFFAILLAASAIAYLPPLLVFGAGKWIALGGPFAFQAGRLLHYALYFFAGLVIGAYGVDRGPLAENGLLPRRWLRWFLAAVALDILVAALYGPLLERSSSTAPLVAQCIYGLAFVICCGTSTFGFLAVFLRFAKRHIRTFDSLRDNAYGMYLIHYVFVVWLQYALLNDSLSAVAKTAIVFVGTLVLSWGTTGGVRCIPAVAKVI